mgnify:CR=1 FL=1
MHLPVAVTPIVDPFAAPLCRATSAPSFCAVAGSDGGGTTTRAVLTARAPCRRWMVRPALSRSPRTRWSSSALENSWGPVSGCMQGESSRAAAREHTSDLELPCVAAPVQGSIASSVRLARCPHLCCSIAPSRSSFTRACASASLVAPSCALSRCCSSSDSRCSLMSASTCDTSGSPSSCACCCCSCCCRGPRRPGLPMLPTPPPEPSPVALLRRLLLRLPTSAIWRASSSCASPS